jgi:hypothetical protein
MRRYFAADRDPVRLLADYLERTSRSMRHETAASEIANGRRMLERFLELERPLREPTLVLGRPQPVMVLGHWLTMGFDLAYRTPEGWDLRHILSDDEIRRAEHLRLYAAAAATHFEGRSDGGPVARVEIWALRLQPGVAGWPRSLLAGMTPDLERRLAEMAAGASGQAT